MSLLGGDARERLVGFNGTELLTRSLGTIVRWKRGADPSGVR
ncbi:MAG TPA: hypothetical protein VLY04_05095 [Bryobacteraceae bacterium]|nr:hypothetical protein [Bryobacteraceae bacterium]